MATYNTLNALFTAINNAIRAKDGTSATFPIQSAPDRIAAIAADPNYTINFPKAQAVAIIENFLNRYSVLSNAGAAQDWATIKSQIFGL